MSTGSGRSRPLSWYLVRVLALGAGLLAAAAARSWFDVVEVEGNSMAPTLLPGEWLLAERWTYARRLPRRGEIVLSADPREPMRELIKRVASVDAAAATLDLRGDAPHASTDSRVLGDLPLPAVSWRVVARYWPPSRAGRLGSGVPR